jgi:hypothetical protein
VNHWLETHFRLPMSFPVIAEDSQDDFRISRGEAEEQKPSMLCGKIKLRASGDGHLSPIQR